MRERPIKIRKVWKIKPVTKIKESAKVYKRPKAKRSLRRIVKEELR